MAMKKIVLAVCIMGLFATPGLAVELKNLDVDLGLQHRVMYNYSNIKSTEDYEFFRQRLRLNLDIHTGTGVGSFLQLEYRGGWGGSSPSSSDPRDEYAVNVFNRLQARGIRYGYLYFPLSNGTVQAGLLPVNDRVDQMIFSGDWDFNVGGIAYAGKSEKLDYRIAYLRLVEGTAIAEDKDEHFIIGDLNANFGATNAGIHYYGTYGKICNTPPCTPASFDTLNETWLGADATAKLEPLTLRGVALFNTGEQAGVDNDGSLGRLEASTTFGSTGVSLLGIYSSGKNNGNGFQTIEGILSTGGYWAYTYIFTPHGPSDVNDFGLEAGNRGYGLTTIQGKVDIPVTKKVSLQLVGGWFKSNKSMAASGRDLGTEVGGQLAVNLGKSMNLEVGGAWASLGEAGRIEYNSSSKDSVYEAFSRLQLEF